MSKTVQHALTHILAHTHSTHTRTQAKAKAMQILKSIKKEQHKKNKQRALYGFLDNSALVLPLLSHFTAQNTQTHTHTSTHTRAAIRPSNCAPERTQRQLHGGQS